MNINYPVVRVAIPPGFKEHILQETELYVLEDDVLEIDPDMEFGEIEEFVYETIEKINNYHFNGKSDYILMNVEDYMLFIWYFTNDFDKFTYPKKVAGADIIIAPVFKPTPMNNPKQELFNYYRKHKRR